MYVSYNNVIAPLKSLCVVLMLVLVAKALEEEVGCSAWRRDRVHGKGTHRRQYFRYGYYQSTGIYLLIN